MSFYNEYVRLCIAADKTPSGAALEMNISKATVNRWKNGGGITDATAQKVADFFGVPVSELTKDAENEKSPAAQTGSEALSPARRELLDAVADLSDDQIRNLLGLIREAARFA